MWSTPYPCTCTLEAMHIAAAAHAPSDMCISLKGCSRGEVIPPMQVRTVAAMLAECKRHAHRGAPPAVKFAFTTDPPDRDGDHFHPRRMARGSRGDTSDASRVDQQAKMAGIAQRVAEQRTRLEEEVGKSRGRERFEEEEDEHGLMLQLIAAGGSERWGHSCVYTIPVAVLPCSSVTSVCSFSSRPCSLLLSAACTVDGRMFLCPCH